jgi:hypothetical protein
MPAATREKVRAARVREAAAARVPSFWRRVEKTEGGCWLWTGGKLLNGYGVIRVQKQRVYVHRFAYECEHGPIPPGLALDHLCRVRLCVNPAHLEPVTTAENSRREARALARPLCPKGHVKDGIYQSRQRGPQRYCKQCNRDNQRGRK